MRWRTEGKIGYVRITSFSEQSDDGVKRSMKKIKEKLGAELKGIVLDLRNNPGGLLDQAIKVSDAFLEQGEIVSTRSRRGGNAQRFNAKKGDNCARRIPLGLRYRNRLRMPNVAATCPADSALRGDSLDRLANDLVQV